jgi:hypothetical protein
VTATATVLASTCTSVVVAGTVMGIVVITDR